MPLQVLYPILQTAASVEQPARAYDLRDQGRRLRHAYVVVCRQNTLGGYYDFEGTDWQRPAADRAPQRTAQNRPAPRT